MLENLWHLLHFLAKFMASVFIVGQSVVTADSFVYLLKYVVPLFKVDTLQEWGREPSLVELVVV